MLFSFFDLLKSIYRYMLLRVRCMNICLIRGAVKDFDFYEGSDGVFSGDSAESYRLSVPLPV